MKPRFYLLIFLLIIPFQASLLGPVTIAGVKPDLALVIVYILGLLTGPREAALAGIAVGILQDIGSASYLGFNAFTQGLAGLIAGVLGRQVLNVASLSNVLFLALFSLAESLVIAVFMQTVYGAVPFFYLLLYRFLPQSLYTGLLGTLLLRFIHTRKLVPLLLRRGVEWEE